MNINKQNSCDWVLNPSKRFPGKYYYFNVVTGETVWSLNGAESKFLKNSNSTNQVEDRVFNCPEPATPTNEHTVTPCMFNPRNSGTNAPNQTFSTAIFPKYMNEPHFPNVIWAVIPMFVPNMVERKAMLDQNTQTFEPDRNSSLQTCTIPLSQRFSSLGNINTISSPSDYNFNYCKPVEEFHTSTPMKNLWNVTEQVLDTGNQGKISQLQYKRKLVEPKLTLKEAKLKKMFDKDTYNDISLSKANENTENRSLRQPNKVDYSGNDKSNEDSLKRLDESDLRYVLQSKRQESNKCYEKKEKAFTEKKRVSFNLNNYDGDCFPAQNNEETVSFKASIPINLLKKLSKIPTNNEWYISVDEDVLLEDFDFIMHYVATDNSCKLLIPDSMVKYIEELAMGAHGGRSAVILARNVHRRLGDLKNVQVVETEDGASVMGDVIKCCLSTMDMGIYVALITKNRKLEKSAKSYGIHAYNLDNIKNGTKPSTESVCTERNISNNLFLQSADDFDPFILSKSSHTVNSIKKTAFDYSDSTFSDYDKDNPNHANDENIINYNTSDVCQTIDKLKLNDKIFSNIRRVIKVCDAKTEISEGNTDNNNINRPIKSIFDHIGNNNEYFNRNNNPIKKLTKRVDNNLYKAESSNNNVRDNLSRSKTTISDSNDKYTNTRANIWKVRNDNNNLKYEHSDILEDKLRRFEIKDETIENNIVLRLEEWFCCYVQIMEELINYVLHKNLNINDQVPFNLRDGLVVLKNVYLTTKDIKVIIEKLLSLYRFCPMKAYFKKDIDIAPNDFLKILGCGFLLVDSLEDVLSEDLSEIKGLLTALLENIENCHSNEDLLQVETPMCTSEADEGLPRTNFIKRRRDIVEYLKKHFVEWRIYDDCVNEVPKNEKLKKNQKVKIIRTFGRNLSSLKIDSKKRITFENPNENNLKIINKATNKGKTNKHTEIVIDKNTLKDKDGRKVIRNERLIVANNDKEESNFDLDALDYSEMAETVSHESKRFDETQNNSVDLSRCDSLSLIRDRSDNCDVRDTTADIGFEYEIHVCTIRCFFAELSASFKLIYTFIKKSVMELRDDGITNEKKKGIVDKAKQTHIHIIEIIQKLKAIIERESSDIALISLILKAGSDVTEDKRLTRYRQTVTKCLEQAQILKSSLKLLLSVTDDDCDLSVSSAIEMNHYNIFE